MFDGGDDQWHFWARVALRACTNVWGGRGFILVPHRDGVVHPELLTAIRMYDPDYVVTLQRTLGLMEMATPGSINCRLDGELLEGEARAQFVSRNGEQPLGSAMDDRAREQVVGVCSPHRRRQIDTVDDWDEDVITLTADGEATRLTKVADMPNANVDVCLAAPPDLGGLLGVAVAARCGVIDMPRIGGDLGLEEVDARKLACWSLAPSRLLGDLPAALVWLPDADHKMDPDLTALSTAFDSTERALTLIRRGFERRPTLLSVGDAPEDFALSYIHQRLYGNGLWLPLSWWTNDGQTDSLINYALRRVIWTPVRTGEGVALHSTSVNGTELDAIATDLQAPVAWSGDDFERTAQQWKKAVVVGTTRWLPGGVHHLAASDRFDQDFVIPVTRNDAGDVGMVAPCPPPALSAELVESWSMHWQVDIELTEVAAPRGRGIDGHSLLAQGQDSYLTWIRSGRDGVVYESGRFDFVAGGTPPMARLARPRLRAPSLATWADLMARQDGRRMRFSAAGRRVELMIGLTGDRIGLAAQFAGPLLPVFRAFRAGKKDTVAFEEGEGFALPTGAGDQLWEGYLTFAGILRYGGSTDEQQALDFRQSIDKLLEKGILRRGLILGCAQCSRPAFVSIGDLAQVNGCPRCSARNNLSQERWKQPQAEPRWYYDLHPTFREHVVQDGDVPLLLSHHLRSEVRSYIDVAEMELMNADSGSLAEADLIALSDGQIITAEAKRPGFLGNGRKLRDAVAKRALLAEQLQADQIVLGTADSTWQQTSIDALRSAIADRRWPVVAPRARLITGLGTDSVQDVELDTGTGELMPWSRR
ncbi:hypothetical protein ACQEVC_34045 [Plantactinospora sp. CA-294935]|uniref:hypothetical protein n=1 Tax=Plantactinospora sp. CA-294935 TaxID=3240012 RepID=UPI003D8EA955